jgi:hypothetical protein
LLIDFPSVLARTESLAAAAGRQRIIDDGLGFLQDATQMIRSPEAFRINLIDI